MRGLIKVLKEMFWIIVESIFETTIAAFIAVSFMAIIGAIFGNRKENE